MPHMQTYAANETVVVQGEYSLRGIFIHPEYANAGIGKQLVAVLENDEFGKMAKRIEIPATLPAVPFYIKCGYSHKDGKCILKGNDILLEKIIT